MEPFEEDWDTLKAPIYRDLPLTSLPVLPRYRDDCDDIIEEAYLRDVGELIEPDDIVKLVDRWENLWRLGTPESREVEVRPAERALLRRAYDPESVFDFFRQRQTLDPTTVPPERAKDCEVMCHIILPVPLLNAFQVAHHYGVGTDLALVRLYLDPWPELKSALR